MRHLSTVVSVFILTLMARCSPVQKSDSDQIYPVTNDIPEPENNMSAVSATTLVERDTYNCTDLNAVFDSRCWQELGLSGYLMDPETGWNHTVRVCSTAQNAENNDGSDCCKPTEPWTTCYLRLAHGTPGQDCSQINSQFCSYQSHLDDDIRPDLKPQVQYIMKNIYAVNDFFTTYYLALGAAQSDAQTVIQALVNELDPIKPPSFSLLALLTALSVGLSFLGAPSIAVSVLGLSLLTRTAAQVLTISLQQAPATARALWPSGTQSSQSIQIGNIETELGNSTNQLAAMINSAVQLLMSDVPTFVKFCESGEWSGSESLSLPSKVEGLDYALRTYMTSEVMHQNGWRSLPKVGPYETLQDVENSIPGGNGFACQMGNNSVCTNSVGSAWYWSQATGNVYFFGNSDQEYQGITPYQVLQDTVNNNWAILEVLFDGSFNCTKEGNYGASVVNFNWDGTLDIACISQLPMQYLCGTTCPVYVAPGKPCPFQTTC
ncbi:hypothetical protein ACLMJK_002146 [Lecanora helva]